MNIDDKIKILEELYFDIESSDRNIDKNKVYKIREVDWDEIKRDKNELRKRTLKTYVNKSISEAINNLRDIIKHRVKLMAELEFPNITIGNIAQHKEYKDTIVFEVMTPYEMYDRFIEVNKEDLYG